MEFLDFARDILVWCVTIAVLWPLNAPLAVLAYKVRNGAVPIPFPTGEFLWRALAASLVFAGFTVAIVVIDYLVISRMRFPTGIIHLVFLAFFFPLGVWAFWKFFAFDDPLDAAGVVLMYLALPIFVLFLLNAFTGMWNPLLRWAGSWLLLETPL